MPELLVKGVASGVDMRRWVFVVLTANPKNKYFLFSVAFFFGLELYRTKDASRTVNSSLRVIDRSHFIFNGDCYY
jgi:hypothetical protein